MVGLALLMGASSLAHTAHAQGGPQSQVVILPNPTPRPADPHDTFRDDPVLRAREQQMIALKRAKMHAKVVSDAKDILVLAQQIRDHRSHQDATATGSDLVGAQQIEKLAKQVKENTKVQ
jgi:hypothetical protein